MERKKKEARKETHTESDIVERKRPRKKLRQQWRKNAIKRDGQKEIKKQQHQQIVAILVIIVATEAMRNGNAEIKT